jgi:phosphoglycolate phosphatase
MTKIHTKPSAIIFDFDDTLVNARPIVHKALDSTFKKFNISKEIITTKNIDVNRSLRDYFHHIFADNIYEARDAYYEYYTDYAKDLVMLENAEMVLQLLRKHGIFTVIVSNKGGDRLRNEVHKHLVWQDYFDAIIGSGDAHQDKPSPMPAKMALQNANLQSYDDVWFIGDSLVDLQTANNLGCKGILFGSNDLALDDIEYYHAVANHKELLELLSKSF